jgi:hypothetical protein
VPLTNVGWVDALTAGKLIRAFDRLHSVSYFVPEAAERFGALGMEGRTPYFAVRSAPMGAVGAEVVAATFYNFNPELVATAIPGAWELASPETVTAIRYEVVAEALPRVLGAELAMSKELARAAVILRRAAEAIPNGDGRPLYAAHAGLPWPNSVPAQLWHAITLLREYRGDGHIAALIANGLSGLDALITHTVAGIGFSVDFARLLRGWSREQWAAGVDGLKTRGLVDDEALTPAGVELRSRLEDLTDELAFAPWRSVSDEDVELLKRVGKLIREAVAASGLFPGEAFGPRYGEHR